MVLADHLSIPELGSLSSVSRTFLVLFQAASLWNQLCTEYNAINYDNNNTNNNLNPKIHFQRYWRRTKGKILIAFETQEDKKSGEYVQCSNDNKIKFTVNVGNIATLSAIRRMRNDIMWKKSGNDGVGRKSGREGDGDPVLKGRGCGVGEGEGVGGNGVTREDKGEQLGDLSNGSNDTAHICNGHTLRGSGISEGNGDGDREKGKGDRGNEREGNGAVNNGSGCLERIPLDTSKANGSSSETQQNSSSVGPTNTDTSTTTATTNGHQTATTATTTHYPTITPPNNDDTTSGATNGISSNSNHPTMQDDLSIFTISKMVRPLPNSQLFPHLSLKWSFEAELFYKQPPPSNLSKTKNTNPVLQKSFSMTISTLEDESSIPLTTNDFLLLPPNSTLTGHQLFWKSGPALIIAPDYFLSNLVDSQGKTLANTPKAATYKFLIYLQYYCNDPSGVLTSGTFRSNPILFKVNKRKICNVKVL